MNCSQQGKGNQLSVFEDLRLRARGCERRVLFLDQSDARIREAAKRVAMEKIAVPVVLKQSAELYEGVEVFEEQTDFIEWIDKLGDEETIRRTPDCGEEALLFGAKLLRAGYVDAAISGAISTTRAVIRAGIEGVGTDENGLVSSFILFEVNGKPICFADCAVIVNPASDELAHIATATADNFAQLTQREPRIAFLSFSTQGSATCAQAAKVVDAFEIAAEARPDITMDGELQFDAAFVPDVASAKAPGSPLRGSANVFVFPDISSGNIAYKVAERIGKIRAVGPVLQGLRKPWMDLSRGCSIDDIVHLASVAALSA